MSAPSEARPHQKVLSCTSCRQRKCKCDKKQPVCDQCVRSGIDCVYPSRKPTRRAPRPRQADLLDRISRLESLVGRADPQKLQQLDDEEAAAAAASPRTNPKGRDASVTGIWPAEGTGQGDAEGSSVKSTPGVSSLGSEPSQNYLGGEFWGILSEEVEGIKQALDQPSEDDDDDEYEETPESFDLASTSSANAPSGFILGNMHYHEKEPLLHPPREWIYRLWGFFLTNVEPLLKFPHHPTVNKQISAFADAPGLHQLSAETNALFFCIYFAGITSTTPDFCQKQMGQPRDVLVERFRSSAERALAAADYLNASDLVTLQAFAIYVTVLRGHSRDRSCWALTALLIRLAQACNLHRDGDGHKFSPYEAEMRRRLWNFIIVLDIRGSEDRGTPAILSPSSHNVIMPIPLNDYDFSPDSKGPLIPTEGIPDNVICLCIAQCSGVFGFIFHPQDKVEGGQGKVHTEDELVQEAKRLEDTFIHRVDQHNIASRYASEIARMVILKMWLFIQYPYTTKVSTSIPRLSRETMLRTAVSIMEISERMAHPPLGERFAWWTATYPQWHPLAVTLAELCIQTEGELVDKAWLLVDQVFPVWRDLIADNASGTLWRPLRKLMKKAKAARANALMKDLKLDEPIPPPSDLPLHQQMLPDLTQTMPQSAMPAMSMGYDAMNLDPSYLFEYPPELLDVNFDQMGMNMPQEMTPWTEFLNDTRMDDSSSGGDFI